MQIWRASGSVFIGPPEPRGNHLFAGSLAGEQAFRDRQLPMPPVVAVSIGYMQNHLIEMTTVTRLFIEPVWADWHDAWGGERPQPLSRNTCGRTSLFLVEVLRSEGIAAEWKTGVPRYFEHGPEIGPRGFRADGRWESHAWVEAGGFIIDITADQFGDDPIIVVPIDDDRYSAGENDTALPFHVENRIRAVAAIWPRWLEHRSRSAPST